MNKEELLNEVRHAACNCDPMIGWTCHYCREVAPKLRKALGKSKHRPSRSPYEPIGLSRHASKPKSPYEPRRTPRPKR